MLSGNRISGISVMEADEKIHIIRSIILYIYNIIIDIYHESPLFTLDAFSENQEFDSIMNTLKFKES